MQVPELDDGASFAGRAIISASKWVPCSLVHNVDALVRASCVIGYSRTETIAIQLLTVVGQHVRMPRHLDISAVAEVPFEDITTNITWEQVTFRKDITPRDDKQRRAWDAFKDAHCGILNIACGGGKTVLALMKIAQRGYPAVVLVSNGGLVDQWVDRAKTFLGMTDDEIGIVQGTRQEWDRPLVICMLQTVVSRLDDIPLSTRLRFGTIIYDECHHMSAQTFVLTADMFYGERFGLTATTDRSDGLERVYYAHLGPVFYSDRTSEIYASVYFKSLSTSAIPDKHLMRYGQLQISRLYEELCTDTRRNDIICEDAAYYVAQGRKLLLLSHSIDHVDLLAEKLSKMLPAYKVGLVRGATDRSKRVRIIEESDITVASFSLAKEGLDIPALDTLLLLTPFKGGGAFQQCRGRVERAYPNKKVPLVLVYEDTQVGPSAGMCKTLRRSLREDGLTYKTLVGDSSKVPEMRTVRPLLKKTDQPSRFRKPSR